MADDDTTNNLFRDREGQTLLKFDDIIGNEIDKIPQGATVTRADLKLTISDDIDNPFFNPDFEVYFMTRDWNESSTWNSLEDGLATEIGNDFDELIGTFSGDNDSNGDNIRYVDISEAVQRWADGESNYGLGIVSESIGGNDDGIELFAAESSQIMFRPSLEVEYTLTT